jgi:ketosteroid isomerase-like protein
MSEQNNLDVVRRGYEAFGHGDMDTLLSLFDEQITWISPGPQDLPTSGRRTGRQQVTEFFSALSDVLEIQRFEPKQFIAQGDQVVVLGEDTSRVKATDKVIEGEWAHVFTLRDGKVVCFQEYIDTAELVAELRSVHAQA